LTPRQKTAGGFRKKYQSKILSATPPPKAAKIVLGDELEYRIARLQIFMGYFVRRGCPIYTIGMLNQATDLDVLAIRYVEPFRRQMLVTECKGGGDGPLDRIFWLSGVKTFVKADEAILVRRGTKWDIKDFAKKSGVNILDLHRIDELERTYKIGENDWPSISDRQFISSRVDQWNEQLKGNPNWWEFYATLSTETTYDEPFAAVNYLLSQLRLMTRSVKRSREGGLERQLISDAISQLCVFLVRICEESFDLSSDERRGFVEKGWRYGNLDPKLAERVLKSAYNLTRQAVLHYANKNIEIDEKLFQIPLPPGSDAVLGSVDAILGLYPISLNLPQICDLVLGEVYLKGNRSRGWLRRIFPQTDLALRLDLLKRYLTFLVNAGACPEEVLDAILLSESELRDARKNIDARSHTEALGYNYELKATRVYGADRSSVGNYPESSKVASPDADRSAKEEFELRPPPTPENYEE
jgi:hypothetical protein